MKANMKKWIAMSLALVLALSGLTACTKDDKEVSSSATGSNAAGTGESGNKKVLDDLGGIKVKIGDWYTAEEVDTSTDYMKATVKFREENAKKYNYTLTRENAYSYADMQELYVNGTMSNSPKCDIFVLYQEKVSQPMMKGLMYDLSTVKTLDFKEKKWNTLVNDLMSVGGGQYGMSAVSEPRGGLFFNKRLFEEAGIDPEEPYDLQKSGKWTWSKLEEYCKKLTKDTDNDGKTDQYAMASFSKYYLPMCAATNNAGFIGKDEDGKYVNTMGTDEFLYAMNWGVGLLEDGYIMPKPDGAAWDWYKAAFRDAEVAMQTAETYEVSAFKDMDDEWGFVMFPYNEKNKDAGLKTIPNDNIFVIPSCFDAEKAEKIGQVFDLYTEPTPGFEEEDAWKENYYNQFKDSRALEETLVMMHDPNNQSISYQPMISDIDYGDYCYSVYARAVTPKKKIEELSSKWDAKIADMNKKYASFTAKK
ncbi:MAG: extracellular solute-binding protein [Tyzzerella sp.]|nr:extracellular solute-binding protein [Tyzzerella sp.]